MLLEINGEPINKFNQLKEAVEKSTGSSISLKVWRDAKYFKQQLFPKERTYLNLKVGS